MENRLNTSTAVKSYKFHMYSAHDTTVQLIRNGLLLTSSECLYQAWNKSEITNKNCIYNVSLSIKYSSSILLLHQMLFLNFGKIHKIPHTLKS